MFFSLYFQQGCTTLNQAGLNVFLRQAWKLLHVFCSDLQLTVLQEADKTSEKFPLDHH